MKFISFLFAMFLLIGSGACQDSSKLLVGTAKVNITPDEPVILAGYPGWMQSKRVSEGIHDSLYCRATFLKIGDDKVLLISSDLIGNYTTYEFFRDAIMENTGLKADEVFLSCTHTHSGPVITSDEEYKNTNNYKYTQKLKNHFIEAANKAMAVASPGSLEMNNAYAPIGVNRRILVFSPDRWPHDGGLVKMGRNSQGLTDNEFLVLKMTNENGNDACLFNYSCHNRSLNAKNKMISSDFFGVSEQLIEKIIGEDMVASAFAGASGDIDPYCVTTGFNTENYWTPETELMGAMLGQEVITRYRSEGSQINPNSIKTAISEMKLPARKYDEYITNDSLPKVGLNVTVASIGEVAIIGLSCEAAVEIGMAIKDASPFKYNFIITHCNGSSGYLSPKEFYKERGYEVFISPFGPEAADLVVKEALNLLYQQH